MALNSIWGSIVTVGNNYIPVDISISANLSAKRFQQPIYVGGVVLKKETVCTITKIELIRQSLLKLIHHHLRLRPFWLSVVSASIRMKMRRSSREMKWIWFKDMYVVRDIPNLYSI